MALSHLILVLINFNEMKYLPAIFWFSIILILSTYPGNKIPAPPFFQVDKVVHVLMYAPLSIFLTIAFFRQYNNENTRLKVSTLIVLFCVFFGGIMEILQHYILINRSGNIYDFTANTIGAIIGMLLFPFIVKIQPIKKWLDKLS